MLVDRRCIRTLPSVDRVIQYIRAPGPELGTTLRHRVATSGQAVEVVDII